MIGTTARTAISLSDTQQITRDTGNLATRKIWLPKLVYNALPLFYIVSGIAAFLATMYISGWFWVLPHYLLFSVACMHLGVLVYRRRARSRKSQADIDES